MRNLVGEGNEHWVRRARLEMHSEGEEIEESKRYTTLNRGTTGTKRHVGGGDERAEPRKEGSDSTEERGWSSGRRASEV